MKKLFANILALVVSICLVSTVFAKNAPQPLPASVVDGQILRTVMVVNTFEINAAQVALQKTNNEKVKKFAHMMIEQHSQNNMDANQLVNKLNLQLTDSDQSRFLQKQSRYDLAKLKSTRVNQFDKFYMESMVNGHKDVLDLIDNQLLYHAQNSQVQKFLKKTRKAVVKHLAMAKSVLKKIG